MNQLRTSKRLLILRLLLEGNSIRGTARLARVSPTTVLKLVRDSGRKCLRLERKLYHDISAPTIQCDEMWSFVHGKTRNIGRVKKQGDVYIWVALDHDSRFLLAWRLGRQGNHHGHKFLAKLATRVTDVQEIRTDGNPVYLYTPFFFGPVSHVVGPTEYVERHNLNMRTQLHRLHRKTNGFSKSWRYLYYSLAMYSIWYNFCRIHQSLEVTPAMAIGLEHKPWRLKRLLP